MTASSDRDAVLERFTEWCARDARIVAAFVGGSVARGDDDRSSDLDLCIVSTDKALVAVRAERPAVIEHLGTPLFLEDWGKDDPVLFAILADGTEIELHCVPEGRLGDTQVGPIRPLLDPTGILAGLEQETPMNDEPYWKIDREISVEGLGPLAATIAPLDLTALGRAATDLVAFFGVHGRRAAQLYDPPYPDELETLMRRELEAVLDG